MKRISLLIILILIACAPMVQPLATPTAGRVYYVASSGSDTNSGTQSAPIKTIAKVNSLALSAGDSVLFRRGDVWATQPREALRPKSGVVYSAYGAGNLPVLDGSNQIDSGDGWRGVVVFDGVSNVTLDSFEITKGNKQNIGIGFSAETFNIVIQNSKIHDNRMPGYMGIYVDGLGGKVHDITIRNNELYNCAWNCIRVTNGVANYMISGNIIHDTKHGGIDTYPSKVNNKNGVIEGNTIYNISTVGIYLPANSNVAVTNNIIHDAATGIKPALQDGFTADNIRMGGNIIYNINGDAPFFVDSCVDCAVANNTMCGARVGIIDINNTRLVKSPNVTSVGLSPCIAEPMTPTPTTAYPTSSPTPTPTITPTSTPAIDPRCDPKYLPSVCIYRIL